MSAAGVDERTMQEASELVSRVGSDNQREIVRLCCRLVAFKKLAESATAIGERENAERMFAQEQALLRELFGTEQKFEQIF